MRVNIDVDSSEFLLGFLDSGSYKVQQTFHIKPVGLYETAFRSVSVYPYFSLPQTKANISRELYFLLNKI